MMWIQYHEVIQGLTRRIQSLDFVLIDDVIWNWDPSFEKSVLNRCLRYRDENWHLIGPCGRHNYFVGDVLDDLELSL